jgi:hypothetical protein
VGTSAKKWAHLRERAKERQISQQDLFALAKWKSEDPDVPDGDWCKDFGQTARGKRTVKDALSLWAQWVKTCGILADFAEADTVGTGTGGAEQTVQGLSGGLSTQLASCARAATRPG